MESVRALRCKFGAASLLSLLVILLQVSGAPTPSPTTFECGENGKIKSADKGNALGPRKGGTSCGCMKLCGEADGRYTAFALNKKGRCYCFASHKKIVTKSKGKQKWLVGVLTDDEKPDEIVTQTPSPSARQYQKLNFGNRGCGAEFEITSQEECSRAITSLGITDFDTWIRLSPGRAGMPRGCSLQINTNTMIWNEIAVGTGRHDLAPVCKAPESPTPSGPPLPSPSPTTPSPPLPSPSPTPAQTPSPTSDSIPQYQALNYRWPGCPDEFDITSQEECSRAIAALGVANFEVWPFLNPGREGMPRGCSLQKDTNAMIWNEVAVGIGRLDLAPVCKWTGTPTPPEPTPAPVPNDRDTVKVTPEEWNYFLAFQESRARGFSCPCNGGTVGTDGCNELEFPGKHFHPPNPERATFDCTLWIAAYRHAEDQAIQNYCSHTAKDGTSPRMRSERVGATGGWEHTACAGSRHKQGAAALRGLQTSPGHCNSMYDVRFRGFASGHSSPSTGRDVWTIMYNRGGSDITDSLSCIPEGYTATGELKD